jgi:hypothetical protein
VEKFGKTKNSDGHIDVQSKRRVLVWMFSVVVLFLFLFPSVFGLSAF